MENKLKLKTFPIIYMKYYQVSNKNVKSIKSIFKETRNNKEYKHLYNNNNSSKNNLFSNAHCVYKRILLPSRVYHSHPHAIWLSLHIKQ